jgi:CAAX prenyl protease-like protein
MPQIVSKRTESPGITDETAYILPMITFLALVWAGGNWKELYPWFYVARAIIVAVMLFILWPHYTKIRWNGWWLGALLGIVGIFQWVGMQLALQKLSIGGWMPFKPAADPFNPMSAFNSPAIMWSWIVIRIASASLVVPVMEELFWRDFLWRRILAPADFKLAQVGEKDWRAFLFVSLVFAVVHGNWWLTSIVWALMIGGLLIYTRSLGACIVMHGMTNLLLGIYVLYTHDWSFW